MEWKTASSAYTGDQTGLTADERISSLFQPDTLLSAQYFENLRRKTLLEPEKRLMWAFLKTASICSKTILFHRVAKEKKFSEKAERGIWNTEATGIFLF